LPAVSVVFDKVYYYLVDGVHRYEATKSAGAGEIDANVADGSSRDALLASVGANSRHGPRRSNEDKLVVSKSMVNKVKRSDESGMWPASS
jgi:ParB-like chromosome segregation protein Spo0J